MIFPFLFPFESIYPPILSGATSANAPHRPARSSSGRGGVTSTPADTNFRPKPLQSRPDPRSLKFRIFKSCICPKCKVSIFRNGKKCQNSNKNTASCGQPPFTQIQTFQVMYLYKLQSLFVTIAKNKTPQTPIDSAFSRFVGPFAHCFQKFK